MGGEGSVWGGGGGGRRGGGYAGDEVAIWLLLRLRDAGRRNPEAGHGNPEAVEAHIALGVAQSQEREYAEAVAAFH